MRYRNWDVLLFPGGGRIPVSEFKTQCFVTKDHDSPFLQTPHLGPQRYQGPLIFNQLPVLSTFIPSLPPDSPFQISVHSWETPRPSVQFETNMGPEDTLMFEVRVYIDGIFSSGSLYAQRTAWPQVMSLSSHPDREGNQDTLRFPPFHREILQQRTWDAADPHGRIRVVFAEGFSRPNRSPPFERYRDFLTFSFQHAPLNILENAEIAWPNPKLWLPVTNTPRYATAASYGTAKEYDDHGHSPIRSGRLDGRLVAMPVNPGSQSSSDTATFSGGSLSAYNAWAPHRGFPIPVTQWNEYPQGPRWEPQDAYALDAGIDTEVDDTAWRQRGARSSHEDVAMPDYSSRSSSSRPLSSLTGFSFEHSNADIPDYMIERGNRSITVHLDDDHRYHELIQSLTPTKAAPTMGTRAPSNTPSETMPMPPPKVSAAAMARSAGYTRTRRTAVLTDSSQPSTREVSGSSQSLVSERSQRLRMVVSRKSSKEVLKDKQKMHKDQPESDKENHVHDEQSGKATQESPKQDEQDNLLETAKEIAKKAESLLVETMKEAVVEAES